MESKVGISLFLTTGPRIGGTLKSRPQDFIVQEIDQSHNLAQLTSEIFIHPEVQSKPSLELSPETLELLTSTLGAELTTQLSTLNEKLSAGDKETILEIPCPASKQDRCLIHQTIKAHMPQLTSSTELSSNIIKIYSSKLAESFNKRQKLGLDSRGAKKLPGAYVKFILYKESYDTMKALKILARAAGIKEKSFGYAGIKDKCAKTTQNVTVYANYLQKLQSAKLIPEIQIGNFQYTDQDLKIGDLYGNFFKIVIRDVHIESEEQVQRLFKNIQEQGFINYFGTQRFGNCVESPTHLTGLSILLKNYEKAVNFILSPRPTHNDDERNARENWHNLKNIDKSLEEFPSFCHIERTVLSGMKNAGSNTAFLNGIMALPRNSRLLYGHAYQSYIWNNVVSKRMEMSLTPIPGDLIMDEQTHVAYLDESNYMKYQITDVVLPLPGSKILLPKNELAGYYEELLAKDGISIESFEKCQKEFALTGSYRKIIGKVGKGKCRVFRYDRESLMEQENGLVGVEVEFELPASSYATICLRELIGLEVER